MRLIESIYEDIRYALRMMRSSVGLTAVAILSLALGIGTTIAIFSVMYALILKPLPVTHPEQLVSVEAINGWGQPLFVCGVESSFEKRQDIFSPTCSLTTTFATASNCDGKTAEQRVDRAFTSPGIISPRWACRPFWGRTLAACG